MHNVYPGTFSFMSWTKKPWWSDRDPEQDNPWKQAKAVITCDLVLSSGRRGNIWFAQMFPTWELLFTFRAQLGSRQFCSGVDSDPDLYGSVSFWPPEAESRLNIIRQNKMEPQHCNFSTTLSILFTSVVDSSWIGSEKNPNLKSAKQILTTGSRIRIQVKIYWIQCIWSTFLSLAISHRQEVLFIHYWVWHWLNRYNLSIGYYPT